MNGISLDKKDRKIISVLKGDARASIREISETTGIRPSTVHKRIQKLVDTGVIENFTISLNDEKVGEGFTVHMLISGSTERYLDKKFLKSDHLKGVYGITGEYDMLLKMKFESIGEFNDFLLKFREKHGQHLHRTLTMVQTISLKDE